MLQNYGAKLIKNFLTHNIFLRYFFSFAFFVGIKSLFYAMHTFFSHIIPVQKQLALKKNEEIFVSYRKKNYLCIGIR